MVFQPINDLAEYCAKSGIKCAIISPGSRNAPLTLAFVRHPDIHCYVIPDERSAGFIGIGIFQSLKRPVVLICTSGTAGLNYSPAVAEAFFQNIPLLILTADRPPELIDQQDGQTIYQEGMFGKHVKKSFNLDPDYNSHKAAQITSESIQQAIVEATNIPFGPVHINVPFREPFYPDNEDQFHFNKVMMRDQVSDKSITEPDWHQLQEIWQNSASIMVLGRQMNKDNSLLQTLNGLPENIVIAGDVISNHHSLDRNIGTLDLIKNEPSLVPELLVTFGKSGISKRLKQLLHKHSPKHHWHIQLAGKVADTYQSIDRTIPCHPIEFFEQSTTWQFNGDNEFASKWKETELKSKELINDLLLVQPYSELPILDKILNILPDNVKLHLANSLSVRLVNFVGLNNPTIEVFSNRGTSGIDGCSSTAFGMALTTEAPVVLITGDMALFYDRNAFWNNYNPKNLFIVVLNNNAGGIFGVIDGPDRLPELSEYFETRQNLSAQHIATEYKFEFIQINKPEDIDLIGPSIFVEGEKPKIIEINTDLATNKSVFHELKKRLK